MHGVLSSTAVLALMLGASDALAQAQPQETSQPTATSATTGPAASTDMAGRVICRPVVVNGMVIHGRQACHTQVEWDSIRQHNRQQLDQIQLNNLTMQPH
jgi:hypothetical protein